MRQLKRQLSDIAAFPGLTFSDELADSFRYGLQGPAAAALPEDHAGFRPTLQIPVSGTVDRSGQLPL